MRGVMRRTFLTASAAVLFSGFAVAQDYPSRPVKIIVPFPAGGSNDIIARIVAQKLTERNGQTFLVENRGGAGGNIGAETVASAEPDGYTLLLTAPPPLTINGSLYKKLPFDPAKAFAPIALIASVPIVLVVNPSVQAKNVGELIALAKAKPGSLNFGSSGIGSTNHLAGELLKSMAGVDIVHVPYRGAAPAMNDLLAGQIPFMFDNMPAVLPQVQGKAHQCDRGCRYQACGSTARRADRGRHHSRLRGFVLVRTGGAGQDACARARQAERRARDHSEDAGCQEAAR
ncbi:tripartite-type tricarboxylate transporter receptor subunit TctC [Bradyrhizobium sp. S3.14.4]